jgi:hypothetical protein
MQDYSTKRSTFRQGSRSTFLEDKGAGHKCRLKINKTLRGPRTKAQSDKTQGIKTEDIENCATSNII